MTRSMILLWLAAALSALAFAAWAQDSGDAVQPNEETGDDAAVAAGPDTELGTWIATVETVVKAGGEETKSQKKIWHKGLKERVEEDAEGGVRVIIIDAQAGHRTVIEPGGKYAMKYALPDKGPIFFEQRKSAGMGDVMRKQGFEIVGPHEVDEEEILGIACVVRELSAQPSAQLLQQNPKLPELMMFRIWEPKEPEGLPAALKLAQITKGLNVTEFIFTSLQRDPVIDEALFEIPEGMLVYDYATSVETVREKIEKTREEYLKKQREEQESGGEPPDDDEDAGGEE